MNKNYKLCDMHIHSQSSHDSEAKTADIANAACEKEISAIAITDHCDIQYFVERDMPGCISASISETEQTAKAFGGKTDILKGVELGEGLWNEQYAKEIINLTDFDVIIGSVHAVRFGNTDIPYSLINFAEMTAEELDGYLNTYFDDVFKMVNQGLCDIMAHLTCPLRYINGKYKCGVSSARYEEKINAILEYIIKNSIAMEINTSGVCTEFNSFMPDEWIIKRFKELGGYLVTLGSDAHIPQNVGKGFDKAIETLKKYGYEKYFYYKNRKSTECKI